MVKIAVEHPFTSVREALKRKGYKSEMLEDKSDSMDYDCVVVRDKESLADYTMNVPLVEAHGRTLYEIIEEVEERLVRTGKLEEEKVKKYPGTTSEKNEKSSAGGFIAGAATGAVIGAAAGLLLTPKSGKELQQVVKDKVSKSKDDSNGSNEGSGQTKEKLSQKLEQLKGKANEVKGQASGYTEKAKGKVDELKAKKEEKKEEKELKKQEKEIEKEAKQEEKARKEHEKAEKQAQKEIEKAEKEEKKDEKGKIEVVEMGAATVDQNRDGKVTIQKEDKNN